MGTTAEKLAYLKETKNQIKQALETPSNVMRDYANWIKKYVDNQPTSIVTDGICENALDVPLVSLGVDGNSYQGENPSPDNPQDIEVIDGVNLFDGEIEVGWINTYGELTQNNNRTRFKDFKKVKAEESYYVSSLGIISTENWWIYYYDENKQFISFTSATQMTASNNIFITPSNCAYIKGCIAVQSTTVSEIMLTKGTTPKPYLPHGHIGLRQSGKNILLNNQTTKTINGIEYTVNEDKSININGTATSNSVLNISEDVNLLKPNTSYIISGLTDGNTSICRLQININDKSFGMVSTSEIKFTTPDVINKIQVYIVTLNGYTINNLICKPMIRLASITDDTYEPYHEPKVYPINLNGNSIAKLKNTDIKDLLEIYRNGDVEIEKKEKEYVVTGNENINRLWGNDNIFAIANILNNIIQENKTTTNIHIKSNSYQTTNYDGGTKSLWNLRNNNDYPYLMSVQYNINDVNFGKILIKNTRFSSIDNFKLYLQQQYDSGIPVKVHYILNEPETIKLPSIDPIELWEGTNNFKLITNLDTTFEMEYVVNKDYLETQNLLNIVEGENI